ncbi:MAG: glutamate synthase [Treponema sp.]|jgi:glutamate synthase domain-containing protein 3|nr:glutamate synthase [Treponema sp.]
MLKIEATPELDFSILNKEIRDSKEKHIRIINAIGQRYIASGLAGRKIEILGTPGNALGAYLDGSTIIVEGNVQDATGDTMNSGEIIVHGNAGDATGYAMRGGEIYIRGNTGYRAGIHMKAYKTQQPAVVIGGKAGSFLGEYQAGGIIIVLNLAAPVSSNGKVIAGTPHEEGITGAFVGTGMHGGAIYLRTDEKPDLPKQIKVSMKKGKDIPEIKSYINKFCNSFPDVDKDKIFDSLFAELKPDSKNPYKQLYTTN